MRNIYTIILILICLSSTSCDNSEKVPPQTNSNSYSGTSVFRFSDYAPFTNKPIDVFYHIPENIDPNTPIVFVFHGGGRNAANYRNAWIAKANEYNFMIFAPRFIDAYFPGGDGYNLANVFVDGDNPSTATLNDEADWTFSVIEPLFDHIKSEMDNLSNTYDVYGHSAGAQFVHRFMMLKPNVRVKTAVASAAGWYTVPDTNIDFPYGIQQSPIENADLTSIFSGKLILLVGDLDNDPNYPGLRRNSTVDLQGTNRLDRATHFFQRGQEVANDIGSPFNWRFETIPGIGHGFEPSSRRAADILFE